MEILMRECILCGKKMIRNQYICEECKTDSMIYHNAFLENDANSYDDIMCLFEYNKKSKKCIYHLKERHNVDLLNEIAEMMAMKIDNGVAYDCITYIPSTFYKWINRGYNPAKLLAKRISQIKHIPLKSVFYKKNSILIKDTKRLKRNERKESIEKSIITNAKTNSLEDLNVLIVDDVLTTGSTLNHCSRLLKKEKKVKSVHGLVIASGRNF